MFNANAVDAKLQLIQTIDEDDGTSYYYDCNEQLVLEGDTLWGYTNAGDTVTVKGVCVHERKYDDTVCYDVNVMLEEEQLVYTDNSFAEAISKLINMDVDYTEQGMQDYGIVSMEN